MSAYVPLLINHLRDNDFPDDATLAGGSLVRLGTKVLPWLEKPPIDEQQAFYLNLIRRAILRRQANPKAKFPFSWGGMYRMGNGDR